MSDKPIIILGINGNCIDIAEAVEAMAQAGADVRVLGYLDDADAAQGRMVGGYPVLGRIAAAADFPHALFVNGIGSTRSFRAKRALIAATGLAEKRWATVVHPAAFVSRHAQIGHGTVLLAHACVGARARVGPHCMMLQRTLVSHDSVIGGYGVLASAACVSGGCVIEDNVYLGANSSIREGLSIGAGALIGMGAVVVKDIPPGVTAFGNPACVHP